MRINTLPQNDGERAALARSLQLTEFVWTPVRDIPTYFQKKHGVLPAGIPLKGFPYASEEKTDTFIGENVSIESFLSAIKNPYSKLYQPGQGQYYVSNLGLVCNGLVRYAFGIPYRVSTMHWEDIPGMRRIADHGCYAAEDIRLLDVLYAYGEGRNHVALVTNILRKENGEICEIEVSDAVRPTCRRACYPLEEFFKKYALFHLDRYEYLAEVPPVDEADAALLQNYKDENTTPALAVDNGDRSNYRLGELTTVSAFIEGEDTLEIYKNGTLLESYPLFGRAFLPLEFDRGYYTARLKENGAEVQFAVVGAKTDFKIQNGSITVSADPCDKNSTIHYMDFRAPGDSPRPLAKYEVLTEEEKQSGIITRKIPEAAGSFKVYYKNAYGIFTHPLTRIL